MSPLRREIWVIVVLFFITSGYVLLQDVIPFIRTSAGALNHRERVNINKSINQTNINKDILYNGTIDFTDSTAAIKYIDFLIENGWEQQEGRVGYNDDDKTLEVGLDAGSVLQLGQEIHVRTLNNSGITIPDGKAVYISGAQGSRPTIAMANNNSDTAYSVIGLTTQEIIDGRVGYSTTIGLVRGLNTAIWPAGTILWLDSIDGGLTATRPIAPHIAIVMGVVVRSNAEDGIIGVKTIAVQRMAWASDVKAQGAQTHWDFLYWNTDSLRWELNNGLLHLNALSTYADNAAAITGGLVTGDVYRTATGELMIVYTP